MGIKTSLGKFAGEAARAIRNFKYDIMGDGSLYFSGSRKTIGGVFRHAHAPAGLVDARGNPILGDWAVDPNKMVFQGLDYALNAAFGGQAQLSAFSLAPFSGNVTPADSWTAANFTANSTEFTAYTNGTRLPWTTAPSTARAIGNSAALVAATATFSAGGPYNVYGIGLLSASAKSATTGTLIAATRFAAPRLNQVAGDKLAFEYVISASDAS